MAQKEEIVEKAGKYLTTSRIQPSLVIEREQIDQALSMLDSTLKSA